MFKGYFVFKVRDYQSSRPVGFSDERPLRIYGLGFRVYGEEKTPTRLPPA